MLRRTIVDFSKVLRPWDGFGVNYVQTAQTLDPASEPQDYGGFGILCEADRRRVIEMVFGRDGLRPALLKMFLDPFHQDEPGAGYALNEMHIAPEAYDHERTTEWMRRFARAGHRLTRERGEELSIIVTLYGPPAWMTRQRVVRGRDLDPALKVECAKYLAGFAQYLCEEEGLPVCYVSLHNEGEDWARWNEAGTWGGEGHDYNMYWPPEQVVEFLKITRQVLDANGIAEVGVTPGESSNWLRFAEWGYAHAIADDREALDSLGLITSHGFWSPGFHRWAGDWRSAGIDALRARRPELHAWVTSTSWSKMDACFLNEIHGNIHAAKVNGLIPWACIQRPGLWKGGDPNPGTAFRVGDRGELTVEPGYWWYRQVCLAGRPGTGVARVASNDTQLPLLAFADNGTGSGDAFVVLNTAEEAKEAELEIRGSAAERFDAVRTSETERCEPVGEHAPRAGKLPYTAPPLSATTFLARPTD